VAEAVAFEAEGAHVGEVAFAAAFSDGHDVIGIPEIAARAPFFFELAPGSEIEFALIAAEPFCVDAALGTAAVVASEDLLAQIAGVRAKPPFVDAGGAAKGKAAAGDQDAAAAAQAALALDPTAGLDAPGAHTRNS
jgi:hypothetical protein